MRIVILHDQVAADARPDEHDALVQADFVRSCLARLGHTAEPAPVGLDMAGLAADLARRPPDAVFNLVESMMRSGRLIAVAPSLVEALGLPCTGCGSAAVFLTSNKSLAKRWMRARDLPTPDWLEQRDLAPGAAPPGGFTPGTWIVKSVWEHASVGIEEDSVVLAAAPNALADRLAALRERVGGEAMAERFIDGREFNVALLARPGSDEPEVLPPAEIEFEGFAPEQPRIVGFSAKWIEGSFAYCHTSRRYEFPPEDAPLLARLAELSRRCWREFGLRGYARVDFRIDKAGTPWILEINANPCISPDAGFMAAAERAGLNGPAVIERIVGAATAAGG